MILIQQLKLRIPHTKEEVLRKAAKSLQLRVEDFQEAEILRRSLDARKKPELYYIYSVQVAVKNQDRVLSAALKNKKAKEQFSAVSGEKYRFPEAVTGDASEVAGQKQLPPVIIGAGPAGLFCAYYLALAGRKPVLLERGKCVEERQQDVENFWRTGVLDPSSNVQFGEGGAGTFSDGKLNTLVKDKDGRNRAVLETFVNFGAKESILYDAKPHIGTDVLAVVVKNMREEIIRLGGTVRFQACMTDYIAENGRLTGIVINNTEKMSCEQLVLATGHSARDTFAMLLKNKLPMEAKSFAVGFRVEHPQDMINASQYGELPQNLLEELGTAAYKVTAKTSSGRGVYSFCMCPGGHVVNASSEEGRLAVNGMSYSGRDGKNANSAIIVSVSPEDYPGEGPLSGIAFQRELEERAFAAGAGKIPAQRYGEFKNAVLKHRDGMAGTDSVEPAKFRAESCCDEAGECNDAQPEQAFEPCTKGEVTWTDLTGILPEECNQAFVEGMEQFGHQIHGFNRPDAILLGVESRTSSPVRILRDDSLQSEIRGIYPCGEGAGYAGGITSAAMDGLRVAEMIAGRGC